MHHFFVNFFELLLYVPFLPRELIEAKWLIMVFWISPSTYILEANRFLLGGTSSEMFFIGVLIKLITLSSASILFALSSSKRIQIN